MRSLRKLAVIGLIGIAPAVSMAGLAAATPSPNGPGQPGTGGGSGSTSCGNFMTTPGHSANAQSPFNPSGNAGTRYAGNPGTASMLHSNSPHSVSEYDIACYQQTFHTHEGPTGGALAVGHTLRLANSAAAAARLFTPNFR